MKNELKRYSIINRRDKMNITRESNVVKVADKLEAIIEERRRGISI